MAKSLVWCDLTAEKLMALEALSDRKSIEEELASTLNMQHAGKDGSRQSLLVEFYYNNLKFAKSCGFSPEKTSALFSICKMTHFQCVDERLIITKGFEYFRQLLLAHSVHRPPYSVGVFSLSELKTCTDYMLNAYFRHYKLFQYCFTKRYTLDVALAPTTLEFAPILPPLKDALNTEKWDEKVAEVKQAEEDRLAAEAEAARVKAEEEREAKLKQEYEEAIPDEITDRVQKVLAEKLVTLKQEMDEQFSKQEEGLLSKIATLEEQQAAAAAAAAAAA